DLDHRLRRVDDAEVHHGVDLDRNIVARDHVLRGHVHDDGAQVDAHHLLDAGDDQDQTGPLDLPEAAEHEHDGALVFAQDTKGADEQQKNDQNDAAETYAENHRSLLE